MKYQTFSALVELIKRYKSHDEKKETVIICSLSTLSELRSKCVKSLFETRNNNLEYFYGARILLDTTHSITYLAVAYEDKTTGDITDLTEITEEAADNE
jgi:hypothetical protein